eukprot:8122728-Karenia_brevis.AAC.1
MPAILAASVYLRVGDKASQYNIGLLEFLGSELSRHALPLMIGGDFNMTPEELEDTLFVEASSA